MIKSFRTLAVLVLGFVSVTSPFLRAQTQTSAAIPYPTKATPKPADMGAFAASGATSMTVTIALKQPKMDEEEALLKSVSTPGDPQFHKFLTADQFSARFAPSNADVAKVITGLAKFGLTAQRASDSTVSVTGSPANIERAFSVSLHNYHVAASRKAPAYSFHAPTSDPTVPSEFSASVAGVVGLDSRPDFHPHNLTAEKKLSRSKPAATASNSPGLLTVTDFAEYYDVKPIYKEGHHGGGRTIGIMTLANFTKSDAYTYWSALGLDVPSDRITTVSVDGGPGAPSDASGSIETTLDVEQAGGIAYKSDVIVYKAPNTDQGFVDLFAKAIEANKADSLSISWGGWEWLDNYENGPVTNPTTGRTVSTIRAVHQLLVRAALQGQSVYAAAADSGAYDVNDPNFCPLPDCSATLSVDYPASDAAITAAGGTTLAGTQVFCLDGAACTEPYPINIKHERVWSWDYLDGLCATLGYDPISCGIFPVGGGGGVSISVEVPFYQQFVPGVQRSQPDQVLTQDGQLIYALPAHYAGRNVPDVSFNADPDTGYIVYYTSDVDGPTIAEYYGGTSFVAPQLNGVSALLAQQLSLWRIGLLNGPLYYLALTGRAYSGPDAPLNAIKYGSNEFYHGSNGYNPGAGMGTMDVANFAKFLKCLYQ